jgi:hypothetical protein
MSTAGDRRIDAFLEEAARAIAEAVLRELRAGGAGVPEPTDAEVGVEQVLAREAARTPSP